MTAWASTFESLVRVIVTTTCFSSAPVSAEPGTLALAYEMSVVIVAGTPRVSLFTPSKTWDSGIVPDGLPPTVPSDG